MLDLSGIQATDQGAKSLAKMEKIFNLKLRNTSVSDAGIAALSGTKITFLDIRNSKVTGKVVETLLNMSGLEKVYVDQKFMGTPAFNRLADAGVKLATKDEFND